MGLGFSPISPSNEFIERERKNLVYPVRKTIIIVYLRETNVNKVRKSILGVV